MLWLCYFSVKPYNLLQQEKATTKLIQLGPKKQSLQNIITSLSQETTPLSRGVSYCLIKLSVALLIEYSRFLVRRTHRRQADKGWAIRSCHSYSTSQMAWRAECWLHRPTVLADNQEEAECFCQRATVLIIFDGGLFRLFNGTRSRHLLLTFKKQLTCSILLNIASPTFMRVESVSKRYKSGTTKQNLGNSR